MRPEDPGFWWRLAPAVLIALVTVYALALWAWEVIKEHWEKWKK